MTATAVGQTLSLEEAMEETDNLLHKAIKRRLDSSDLEVGSFLSGGIDSGLVTAIAAGYKPGLKTFTVSFTGTYDEAPLAKLVADKYQTGHTEINIAFDELNKDVEKNPSPIMGATGGWSGLTLPSYYVSREARKHLTVILNGDGSDEIFGGYRQYAALCQGWLFVKTRAAHRFWILCQKINSDLFDRKASQAQLPLSPG